MDILRAQSQIPIAFGGAAISGEGGGYGFGHIEERAACDLLHRCFDKGIRIFDTAPVYGFGVSERRIGKALGRWREEVFIVSKSGVTWHDNRRINLTNDPVVTQKMLEQSLRDLGSDYIDLYMIHWPDSQVDIRKPMEVLAKAKLSGKIKHIGLCNTNKEDLQKALEVEQIEVVQSEFSFTSNSLNFLDDLKKEKIAFMSWGTFDKGIITGRVTEGRKFDEVDARSWAPWWKKSNYKEKIAKMKKVLSFLKEQGHDGVELALGFNLMHEQLSCAICGLRDLGQLDSILKALNNLPTVEMIQKAKRLYDEN